MKEIIALNSVDRYLERQSLLIKRGKSEYFNFMLIENLLVIIS